MNTSVRTKFSRAHGHKRKRGVCNVYRSFCCENLSVGISSVAACHGWFQVLRKIATPQKTNPKSVVRAVVCRQTAFVAAGHRCKLNGDYWIVLTRLFTPTGLHDKYTAYTCHDNFDVHRQQNNLLLTNFKFWTYNNQKKTKWNKSSSYHNWFCVFAMRKLTSWK